jgi:hypothetical protein
LAGTAPPKSSKGAWYDELRNQLLDIKAPAAAQQKGEKYGQQKAKQEAKTREKKPRGLIEYYGSKLGFKKGGVVIPPAYARGGPMLREIAQRRYT